jgi:uncharacterized protein
MTKKSRLKLVNKVYLKLRDEMPYHSGDYHGLPHLREVAIIAAYIADKLKINVEAAVVAGWLHDCERKDDGKGEGHAHYSAMTAKTLIEKHFPHLDSDEICLAIWLHTDGLVTDDPLMGTLWDADRLTLGRFGHRIDGELISTEPGHKLSDDPYCLLRIFSF